ncbi:hypothetical protein ABIA30_002533 [Mycobacterium sp. MAA66]|uniref:hypothetical protein n=1 Tax=Mycobacterium sp. MAA66 TaxID=3156297 RepID=UPI003512E99A
MRRTTLFGAGAVIAVSLIASGCSHPADSGSTPSGSSATSAPSPSAPAAAGGAAQLQSLVPTPVGTQRTDGPDPVADNGIHLHFAVGGAPAEVMDAYKAALQAKGWSLTTIVSSVGGPGGGGGATYTGTHGDNYAVFDGGGWSDGTHVNVCAWPAKPAEPNCSRSNPK